MTSTVSLTLFMTPKCHRDLRGRHDLLFDPKGVGYVCGQLDLVYDLKRPVTLEVVVTYFMTPKVTVTFMVGLA